MDPLKDLEASICANSFGSHLVFRPDIFKDGTCKSPFHTSMNKHICNSFHHRKH
jgi:hypothetical protein